MSLFNIETKTKKNSIILENKIILTDTTKKISNAFDYEFDGKQKIEIDIPNFPSDFQIGLIIGASG